MVTGKAGYSVPESGGIETFCWYNPRYRGVVIAAAALPTYVDGKLKSLLWTTMGFAGGGEQVGRVGRVDVLEDGKITNMQGEDMWDEYSLQATIEGGKWKEDGQLHDHPMPAADVVQFKLLEAALAELIEFDEDRDRYEPTEETLEVMKRDPEIGYEPGAVCYKTAGFDADLFLGLAQPAGYSSLFLVPSAAKLRKLL
jgi:hypothetical protein